MIQIRESGMIFGNYEQPCLYRIENSKLHKELGDGIKSVEFILLRDANKIFFIEAKSSSPKAETNAVRYHEFIDEIADKFIHSFNMFSAWKVGRLDDAGEAGDKLQAVRMKDISTIFILVIRGHRREWLLPLQEELNRKLRCQRSIWKSRVIVMNDEIAKQYHLIISAQQ